MKNIFTRHLEAVSGLSGPTSCQVDYTVSLLRSIVQYAAIGAYEKIDMAGELDPHERLTVIRSLRNPTDSALTDVLSRLILQLRAVVQPSYCKGWFEPLRHGKLPLATLLNKWTASSKSTASVNLREQSALIEHALQVFADVLPIVSATGDLAHDINNYQFDSASLRLIGNRPVLIQRIRNHRGIWKIDYQTLDPSDPTEGTYSLSEDSPLLSLVETAGSTFTTVKIPISSSDPTKIWEPDILLPTRQTYHFQGRTEQLEELLEWYNSDRNMCLVRGDGGIGKTTLVLEFLHEILDHSTLNVKYFPEAICFYDAKLTRWTPDGFERLNVTTGMPTILDALMLLVSYVQRPKEEWYSLDADSLIDVVAKELEGVGLTQNDVLLVLDNTETLALQASMEPELHRLLNRVSERIARVIVTSRRTESIIAQHIVVQGLDKDSSINLLRVLAMENSVEALKNANTGILEKSAGRLGYKPLLLEVFVRHLTRPGATIDTAIGRVQASASGSLGEFLYEDAWQRLSEENKKVFVVLSMIERPLDHYTVGWVCRELETQTVSWIDSYMETHFGSYRHYGSAGYDIVFVPEAAYFFHSQMDSFSEKDREYLAAIVDKVSGLYDQMQAGEVAYRPDRIDKAFRTPAAKAARLCANKGNIEDAHTWYEEAMLNDPNNSELFDRYAYFLTNHVKNHKKAAEFARAAIRLDGDNEEALYSAGCIEYRLGHLEEGDSYMDRANGAGKPMHLCLMEKGKSRVSISDTVFPRRKRNEMLDQAMGFLRRAIASLPDDRYIFDTYNKCAKAYNKARRKSSKRNIEPFPLKGSSSNPSVNQ